MKNLQIVGNEKSYYIFKDKKDKEYYLDIWRYEEDFVIELKDLPFLKKAIKLLEKKQNEKP